MAYNITKLTNVTIGGNPDIDDAPTAGLLKTLIDTIIGLSNSIVYHETLLEDAYNTPSTLSLINHIESSVTRANSELKSLTYTLEQQMYSDDYHDNQGDAAQPLPTELEGIIFR